MFFSEKGRTVYPLQKIGMTIITKSGIVYLLTARLDTSKKPVHTIIGWISRCCALWESSRTIREDQGF